MISTKIFGQTFRSFQRLLNRNKQVQNKILNKTINPFTQFHISNLYSLTNLISLQLSQLQQHHVTNLLSQYNHQNKVFQNNHLNNIRNNLHQNSNTNNLSNKIYSEISYNQNKHIFKLNYHYQLINHNLPLLSTIEELQNIHLKQNKINNLTQTNHQSNKLNQNLNPSNPKYQQTTFLSQEFSKQSSQNISNLQVVIKVMNCQQQKFDHPSMRKTLYFHQLKDLNEYVKYDFLPKTPLFIQDMNRKKLQMKLLDRKNPYGVPTKAPPLYFEIELGNVINNQLGNKVYFKVKSTYQQTNIIQVGSLVKKYKKSSHTEDNNEQNEILQSYKSYSITGMKIPRNIQQIVYNDIIVNLLQLDEGQILKLHKLAYIGGRIKKLNILMNLHEVMSLDNQQLFNF